MEKRQKVWKYYDQGCRGTASNKILCDKALKIAKNSKYDGYRRGLASMVCKFFDKKSSAKFSKRFTGSGIKNENIFNKKLPKKLHYLITIKSKKEK